MSLLQLHRLSILWRNWMFNQDPGNHVFQVENTSEGEDGELQREAPLRSSRRRFRKVNHRGERELITDGQDAQDAQDAQALPGDLNKMHLTDHPHQQVMHVPASQSGCSIASDSGSSSLSDIYQVNAALGDIDACGSPSAGPWQEEGAVVLFLNASATMSSGDLVSFLSNRLSRM